MSFSEDYVNLSAKCDPDHPHEIWMNKKHQNIIAYVSPPHRRVIKFQPNYRSTFKLYNIAVGWQISIVKLKHNLNTGSYKFCSPLMFFLTDHPSKTETLYNPLYPNIYTKTMNYYGGESTSYEQYNCHGSTLYVHKDEYDHEFFKGRLGPTKKFYSWISSRFEIYFSTFYGGTFNCDLGSTRFHKTEEAPDHYPVDNRHLYYFNPSWTLKQVTDQSFLEQEAGDGFQLEHVVDAHLQGKVYQPGGN